jgi:phage-related tail fiber protein
MSATPCSIYKTVKSGFVVNDLAVLQDCWADLWKNINAISESSLEQLLDATSSTNYSLSRNIGAEIYIPKSVRDQKDK